MQSTGADAVYTKTADASKFRNRTGMKGSVYELDPLGGSGVIDAFTTDPFAAPARMVKYTLYGSGIIYSSGNQRLEIPLSSFHAGFAYYDIPATNNGIFQVKMVATTSRFNGILVRRNGVLGYVFGQNGLNFVIGKCDYTPTPSCSNLTFNPGVISGSTYQIKASIFGTELKMKYWLDVDSEPENYNLEKTDASYSSGHYGVCGYNENGQFTAFDDFTTIGYAATSPVLYAVKSAGVDDASWQAEDVIVPTNLASSDSGNVKVKYCYTNTEPTQSNIDDGTIDALLSGTWLTPDVSTYDVALAAGTGKYRVIAYQFNSNGTQQTSANVLADTAQEVQVTGGGGGGSILKSTIIQAV